jgi:peptide/nickel transport system permease protein
MTVMTLPGTGFATRRRPSVRLICVAFLAVLTVVAMFAPWIAPYSPDEQDILSANLGRSGDHVLGTDSLGRDTFSLVVYGARLSLIGPALVVVGATLLGVTLALTSSWFGGRVDTVISRLCDVLMAFPSLLLAVLAVAILGTGITAPLIALTVSYAPFMTRAIRSIAIRERNLPYIEACQMAGFSVWRITTRHLLPNVRSLIVSQGSFMFGSAMVDLAALSFIGLGVQPPRTEWGLLMSQSRTALLNGQPLGTLVPGLLIVAVVIAVNLFGASLVKDKN